MVTGNFANRQIANAQAGNGQQAISNGDEGWHHLWGLVMNGM
jgi:hypothetical protein